MKKTRLEAIKEIFPNIQLCEDGYPLTNCITAYDKEVDISLYDCPWVCKDCRKKFWDGEIEVPARDATNIEIILAALNELSGKVEHLETLIRISYPTSVTGAPSNRIPKVNVTLPRAIHTGGEAIISKEDSNTKMD